MQFNTGYKLQKRQTGSLSNNQFMNGILTCLDCNSSFRNLRIILSDLRFHNKFQFVKYVLQPIFFSLLSAQDEVNELLPVTAPASSISSHTHKKTFKNCLRKRRLNVLKIFFSLKWISKDIFPPKFDSRLVNADWLIT